MRVLIYVFALCAFDGSIRAQDIRIEEQMPPEKQVASGLQKLTDKEKAALNRWLAEWTKQVVDATWAYSEKHTRTGSTGFQPARSANNTYPTGSGHWIQENPDGKVIKLEDGSMWAINSVNQIDTMLWLPITDITVLPSSHPVGEYRYILLNKEDGEKASAKYLGKE